MATTNIDNSQGKQFFHQFASATYSNGISYARELATSSTITNGSAYYGVYVGRYLLYGVNDVINHTTVAIDFDLSSISTQITALTLKLYGATMLYTGTAVDTDMIIVEGTFDSSIDTGDHDSFTGYGSGWDSSDTVEYSSAFGDVTGGWSTSGYNEITLNSDAISAAETARQAGNRLKLYLMQKSLYFDNSMTGLDVGEYFKINFNINPDGSNNPVLVVTHDDPTGIVTTGPIKIKAGAKFKVSSGKFKIGTTG